MSEVISSGKFIRKKCRNEFEELINLFKRPDREFISKKISETYKELSELFKQINKSDKEFKVEDMDVIFESFFKSFPTCMPSRNGMFFRDLDLMK